MAFFQRWSNSISGIISQADIVNQNTQIPCASDVKLKYKPNGATIT